jgi:hypothetical protein
VKFQVFEKGKILDKFTLSGAYLFGGDGIGIRQGKIAFKDGFIHCKKNNADAAGLALLWPIDGFGKVLLPTTILPEREKPYNLNVEIARAKLMQIVNKREDWSFFNKVKGLAELSEEAQVLFIKALQNIANPSAASELADQSLNKAIFLSERLAIRQADILFQTRSKSHGFGRGCFGCRVDPEKINNTAYVEKLLELFGSVAVPLNWAQIEPERGKYDFSKIDACVSVLAKRKLAITAGPLLCFSEDSLPKWLLKSDWSFEKIQEAAYQYIVEVVTRYNNVIRAWVAVSGLNALNHFGFKFEQILEMTRAANMAIKQVSDRAIKIIELCNPWGEYYSSVTDTIPPLVYMDIVVQGGVNFDAFALKMQFGKDISGMHIRDMMQISSLLDSFAIIAKPIYITNLAVPSHSGDGLYDGDAAGIWHSRWDQQTQAQWIEEFYRVALSKSFVSTVTYSNLADTQDCAVTDSGLLSERLEIKKSFEALKELHDSVFKR